MGQRQKRSQFIFKLQYYAALGIMKSIASIPRSIGLAIGQALGIMAYVIDRKHRLLIIHNLKLAFPDKSIVWRRSVARDNFRNFGMLVLEFFQISRLSKDTMQSILQFEGEEYIQSALSKGKGVILLSAHTGNWELAGAGMSLVGLPINVVVKGIRNPYINDIITIQRENAGTKIINRRNGIKGIVKALRNNEIVCFLVDQAALKRNGMRLNFFNHPAWTNIGVIVLALKYNPTIIPTFALRDGTRHRLVFQKPFELIRTDNFKADIRENALRMNKVVEGIIREYPSQWFWMHNRWKQR
ncbi:MAG: lysophospholipid acyltransferase family protein [bacterium]